MAFVFHVEFGINETALTQALEKGEDLRAERLIEECTNCSYLDEGEAWAWGVFRYSSFSYVRVRLVNTLP